MATTLALITDDFGLTTTASTVTVDDTFDVDVTAKFQINVDHDTVVLDFGFYGDFDKADELHETVLKERVALDKFVSEVLAFQQKFEAEANKALVGVA